MRNLWNLPTPDEGRRYWESWYSWVIHSSIDAMKDAARMMKVHIENILNYFLPRNVHDLPLLTLVSSFDPS